MHLIIAAIVGFGVPSVPDTPEVPALPDIEIPGIQVLEDLAVELDELSASLAELETIVPEIGVIDEASAYLRDLSDTEEISEELAGRLETYRTELVEARDRIASVVGDLDSRLDVVRSRVDEVRSELEEVSAALGAD